MFQEFNDVVTLEEMCEMLRIGKNKAYELLRNGIIGGFKEGRVWKIPKHVVVEYIMKRSG